MSLYHTTRVIILRKTKSLISKTLRNIHSYHPPASSKHRKKNQFFKPATKVNNKNVEPKVYMRDIIRKISNLLRNPSWETTQKELSKLTLKWDSYTVNQVLKTHPPMEKAWMFFNWVSKAKGFKHDRYTYTTMIDIFGEARRIESMRHVFRVMQEKGVKADVVTYTSILHWVSGSGDFEGAVEVWEEMKRMGCCPTVVSYTAYMKVLFDNGRAEEGVRVYKEMIGDGLKPTCHTYTVLMEHLIRSGKCKSALDVFAKMQETGVQPDKASCNILVELCSKMGEAWAIVQILHYMKKTSLVLRYSVYLQAHEALKVAGEDDMLLRQVHPHIWSEAFSKHEVMKNADDTNSDIDSGLLIELLRKNNVIAIDHVLDPVMRNNMWVDSELVSKIIEANCNSGRSDAALRILEYSNNKGIPVDRIVYLSLMGVLIRANDFSKILQIVECMVKIKSFFEPQLASTLIYRLGHAGELDSALKLFDLLPCEMKSSVVYTALIDACFSARDVDKGIELFKTMKNRGIPISLGTYNVLIRGLDICGRADEAKFYRKEKRSLQSEDHHPETVSMEGSICNVLFSEYIA